MGEVSYSPRAKQILDLARREAAELSSGTVDDLHLLLALLGDREGVAAQVLAALGLDHATGRAEAGGAVP